MSLVMFQFTIEHISCICHVLKQDNGFLFLLVIEGSGSCSATTFISQYELF